MDAAKRTATQSPDRASASSAPWLILAVDDDPEMQRVTRLALASCQFDGRGMQMLSAHSAAEARGVLAQQSDIALVLLDVVMETEHAGLDLVRYIREDLGNTAIRIVLRTGQPGQAPAAQVVAQYDIDGYHIKSDLTFQRLQTLLTTGLRAHVLIRRLEQRQQELLRSNQELERFAHAASHDLQTPLRNILSLTQLLSRRLKTQADDGTRELLRLLTDSAGILHRLIDDILEYSRVGQAHPGHQPVDLNELMRQTRLLLSVVIDERGAVLEVEPLPEIEGSATQLECLLRNLVENGIKFQPGPAPRVRVRAQREGLGWKILVEDHGIGIPLDFRAEVFQMFKRLHTQEQYPGSGIGLAMCQKVATLHHGRIEITDTPGGGTTMNVTLPVKQPVEV